MSFFLWEVKAHLQLILENFQHNLQISLLINH